MEGESGVTKSIIDELQLSDMIKRKVKLVIPEVSMMNFNLGISKEIKWKVGVVLLEVSLVNFILGISKEIKRKVKVVLLEGSLMISFFGYPTRPNGRWKWRYSKYH